MHRILTYNVHRCVGTDSRLDVQRIAEVIRSCEAEIVALQELDVGRARTGGVDQAERLAHALGMHFQFHPAMSVQKELYGDAILTRQSSALIRAEALPTRPATPPLEPRGALWVRTICGGQAVDILTSHFGLRGLERLAQARALLGPGWIGAIAAEGPVILLGDFNALPRSRAYRALSMTFRDAQSDRGRARPTFPSQFPMLRLDHIFVSSKIEVLHTGTLRTPLARRASDHLPLFMDFAVRGGPHRTPSKK